MANGIIELNAVQAQNVDALNRHVKGTVDIANGSVFQLATGKSAVAGEGEVWLATAPAAVAGLTHLWMAAEPVIVDVVANGKTFRGIDQDPGDFINIAGRTFSAFKPQIGDVVTLTTDAFTGVKGANGYVVATAADYKLNWGAAAVSGLSLKLIATKYISVGAGTLGSTQRVTAYQFEVVAIA